MAVCGVAGLVAKVVSKQKLITLTPHPEFLLSGVFRRLPSSLELRITLGQ
jgi:hypothetical protein